MKTTPHTLATFQRQLRRPPWRMAAPLMIACLTLVLLGSALSRPSWANGGTTVRIDPASQQVVLDHTATSDVLIEDVTDLYGYEFQITFDPTLVEVVDASTSPGVQIEPGDFLSADWILQNDVDNGEGIIAFALSQQDPSPPRDGSGNLATITWRGNAIGTSPITITYVLLSAPRGVQIPASSRNGQIAVTEGQPLPAITSLSPVSAPAGGPAFVLTVGGANFVEASTVHWDGDARTTDFISTTQLTAAIAASDIAQVGVVDVTVVNPGPGGGASNALSFEVAKPPGELSESVFVPFVARNRD